MKEKKHIKLTYAEDSDPFFKKAFIESIEFLTGRKRIERLYNEAHAVKDIKHVDLWKTVLDKLEVNIKYDKNQLAKIPKEGAVVMISNHPFGVVDGLTFGYLAALARPSFKILVNGVLQHDHMLADYLLPVDFRTTREAMMININTKNEAIKILKEGGTILIFPAGGVSTADKVFNEPDDFEWKRFVVKLIHKSKATVVPLFFHGRNSRLFHFASFVSLSFRLGLLLNEVRNKMGKDIKVSIGDPISFEEMAKIKDRQELLQYLRNKTYELKDKKETAE
jgi:putative hemolysin